MIKFLIGGSPCTHWSIAQKNSRETLPEGIGWELFKNYLIAKEKFRPDFFLYENNKSAAQPIKDQISRELGAPLQYINSALVSAQNRQRFYVHNIPDVPQPEDRGILLRDILENGAVTDKEKAYTLRASAGTKQGNCNIIRHIQSKGQFGYQGVFEPVRIGTIENEAKNEDFDSKQYRVYLPVGKSTTICGQGGGVGAKTGLYATKPIYEVRNGLITIKGEQYPIKLADGYYIIRKLTPIECERLQTLPDNYTAGISNSQRYKCLGNGWTAEVIMHILKYANVPLDEEITVLSMYDGIATGRYCFDKLGYRHVKYYAYEIDKYAMQVAMKNYCDIAQCGNAFQVREEGWQGDKITAYGICERRCG